MEVDNLVTFRKQFLKSIEKELPAQKSLLWKFWLYYFFHKNKKIKKSQIGEIEEFIDNVEIPRSDLQLLDEDIVTFLIGYHILLNLKLNDKFKEKFDQVKEELNKHWNARSKTYFHNNVILTLIILLFDEENNHKTEIFSKFEKTNKCSNLLILFMFLDNSKSNDQLKVMYNLLLDKIKDKYYNLRDSEKVYVAWILWTFRKHSKLKIKEVREIVSSCIYLDEIVITEINENNLNFRSVIYYDLLTTFQKNIIIATEEFPTTYRLLSVVSGIFLFIISSIIFTNISSISLVNFYLNKLVHTIMSSISFLLFILGIFLIHEIAIKKTFGDEQILLSLKNHLKNKIIDVFIFGGIIVTIFINQI